MIRIQAYNLVYDTRDFIRRHRVLLLLLAVFNVAAIVIGVRGGFAVSDVAGYLNNKRPTGYLFITGQKGLFSYYFTIFLINLGMFTLIVLCAANFVTAYIGFLVVFLRSYLFALHLTLYIAFLKLSVLPFVIFCMVPFYLLTTCLFFALVTWAVERSREAHLYGASCDNSYGFFLKRMIFPCVMLGIVLFLEAIIGYFLALGIIL